MALALEAVVPCDRVSRSFGEYTARLDGGSVVKPDRRCSCPCCRYLTISERGGYDICPVCFWEDDGQDDHDAALVRGGPNGALSLAQARANFAAFGACDARMRGHVRPPTPDEILTGDAEASAPHS